jgi:hypothetical protein
MPANPPREPRPIPRGAGLAVAALLLALLLAGLGIPAAEAHQQSTSFTTITLTPGHLGAEISFRPSDLVQAFGFDRNGDQRIDAGELAAGTARMSGYIASHVRLGADFQALTLTPRGSQLSTDDAGKDLCAFSFEATLAALPGEISLHVDFSDRLGKAHVNLTKVLAGSRVQQDVLAPDDPPKRFPVTGTPPLGAQLAQFVRLGIEHIFLGYDHICFLLALIILGGRLRDLIKIVTAFTIAHSFTLILAALQVVHLPSRLIESGIAISIAYVATENFFLRRADHRWLLTFCFGLVHGFGFANVLHDLGLPTRGLVPSLLAFNVGVEIGQLCIVLLLFPITLWLSRQRFQRPVVLTVSSLILLLAIGWFVERAFGLSFMPF